MCLSPTLAPSPLLQLTPGKRVAEAVAEDQVRSPLCAAVSGKGACQVKVQTASPNLSPNTPQRVGGGAVTTGVTGGRLPFQVFEDEGAAEAEAETEEFVFEGAESLGEKEAGSQRNEVDALHDKIRELTVAVVNAQEEV